MRLLRQESKEMGQDVRSLSACCSCCGATTNIVRGKGLCFNCFAKKNDEANGQKKTKRTISHEEDDIQRAFFNTARQLFPQLGSLLFAVPNGGKRDTKEAARLKAQGVTAGVADILCLVPVGGYNCLAMETKTTSGDQSDYQKEFQKQIEAAGGKYVIFRSVAEGIEVLQNYLRSQL